METNENCSTKKCCGHGAWRCVGLVILGIVGFTAFVILGGFVIMWLWNWLIPSIFGLTVITYWQAVGLAVLSKLLFGGFCHGKHRGMHKWHKRESCCGNNGCNCNCGSNGCKCNVEKGSNCCSSENSGKWTHYDEFWKEEGEKAFDEYVKRKNEINKG